jgi:hypothetical protein
MAWSYIVCEGQDDCPGKVVFALNGEHSELVVYTESDGRYRVFPCSIAALLGVQRGTRTHLASEAGECVLSKEAAGVWLTLTPTDGPFFSFFLTANEYLLALSKLVEAKAVQRRITLQ